MNKLIEYYKLEIKKYKSIKNYINCKAIEKRPLIERVIKFSSKRKRILEAGCGTGVNSIYLANLGYHVTGIDKDIKMIEFSRKNNIKSENNLNLFVKDIFKLDYQKGCFDVVFSHGVLEHFSDKDIINMINLELNVADYVIFSVPSNFFKKKEAINGDERFLNRSYWIKLIASTRGTLIEEFVYFYDSDETRIKILKYLNKFTFGLFPFKKPYLGFVIKNE